MSMLAWPFAVEVLYPWDESTLIGGLQDFVTDTRSATRAAFDESGDVVTVFVVFASVPRRAILQLVPVTKDKDACAQGILHMCTITSAVAALYIGEFWFAPHVEHGLPSTHPERQEVVVVAADSPHVKPNRQLWTADIQRAGLAKPALAEWQPWPGTISGRFANLMPPYPRTDGATTGDA